MNSTRSPFPVGGLLFNKGLSFTGHIRAMEKLFALSAVTAIVAFAAVYALTALKGRR